MCGSVVLVGVTGAGLTMLRFLMVFIALVAMSYLAMLGLVPSAGNAVGPEPGSSAAQRLASEAALALGEARVQGGIPP